MANELPSVRPKFDGTRFAKHSIPVELLADLSAYRDLIRDVAKEIYRKENPTRKRVPRAFEAAFKLSLKAVGAGSAVAELVNDTAEDAEHEAEILQFADYVGRGKETVDDAIRSATDNGQLPKEFPIAFLPSFGKIGRHLKAGEVIDFGYGSAKPARYTESVRRTLVLWSSDEVEGDVEVLGKVTGLNNDPAQSFDLKLFEGGDVISGPYAETHEEKLLSAYKKPKSYSVRAKGAGLFNRQNKLLKLTEVQEVDLLDEDDLALLSAIKRIEQMPKLPAGWYGDQSVAPSAGAAEWAVEILKTLVEDNEVPCPFVFPTPVGEIQFEWKRAGGGIEARFDFQKRTGHLFAYGDGDFEIDSAFNLDGFADIHALVASLMEAKPIKPNSEDKENG